ncbi:hypothetical protein KPH14_001994 [Odynerus spinipes]|uniref:Methuselah N-terminal domain-containing protein n=1 Tax=Odynerus spinipes TaxID=1348599 RepID=A0AAD9S173_9HYME|nr:hypothetical protein KPH14_001994 [Odynerus spinipes]
MGSLIERLSSLLLLICQIVGARHVENSPCRLSLTVPLEKEKVHKYENGSLFHEGTLYPSHLYWTVDDTVRGCVCELRPCLRKCCQEGEVLSDGEVSECIKPRKNVVLPDLRLEKDQLGAEIQDIRNIAEHFALVRNRICPTKSYKLEPEKFDEDKFAIVENGSLRTGDALHPQWNFCIDWHESLEKVIVLKCLEPDAQTVLPATQTIYPIMTIVSVPFLIFTFLVYAIIPELRNIYGKTLMCYVACLVTAYCSLINAQFKYLPPGICVTIGKKSTTFIRVFYFARAFACKSTKRTAYLFQTKHFRLLIRKLEKYLAGSRKIITKLDVVRNNTEKNT